MCGIMGYIGPKNAVPILMEGLKRLEYRGYDSAGLAIVHAGKLEIKRSSGKLSNLETLVAHTPLKAHIGLGHIRWATHGRPTSENAHPHKAGRLALVHNGIIENYLALKEKLKALGHTFKSETDTEVIAHLIQNYYQGDLEQAVRKALQEVEGAYALGVICLDEPDRIVAARYDSPLVVGEGEGENFIASDIPALLSHTRQVVFLENEEMAVLTSQGVNFTRLSGQPIVKEKKKVLWDPVMAEKEGYKHFMLKEIFEQPRAVRDTIRGRISLDRGEVALPQINLTQEKLNKFNKVYLVACGTSWHAALVGKFIFEELCNLPTEVDIASEFRYRNSLIGSDSLFIAISQSGETADTLAALREAKQKKATTLSIVNVVDSSIARESDGVLYTHSGPEICVASTKAFTTQMVALYLLALFIGQGRETLTLEKSKLLLNDLVKLPQLMERLLDDNPKIERIAKLYSEKRDFLYLGRGINYPLALEGALKLKELSYIHAEGYPAGEMKHGPIALIDKEMPVLVIAPDHERIYQKVISNIEEVKARDGIVIALATEGNSQIAEKADHTLYLPVASAYLMPILVAIPLQLLAYFIAVLRGCDVDQPRNLAKSVTVE